MFLCCLQLAYQDWGLDESHKSLILGDMENVKKSPMALAAIRSTLGARKESWHEAQADAQAKTLAEEEEGNLARAEAAFLLSPTLVIAKWHGTPTNWPPTRVESPEEHKLVRFVIGLVMYISLLYLTPPLSLAPPPLVSPLLLSFTPPLSLLSFTPTGEHRRHAPREEEAPGPAVHDVGRLGPEPLAWSRTGEAQGQRRHSPVCKPGSPLVNTHIAQMLLPPFYLLITVQSYDCFTSLGCLHCLERRPSTFLASTPSAAPAT